MKKIISLVSIVLLLGMVGWSIYNYVDKKRDTSSTQDDFDGGFIVAHPDDENGNSNQDGVGLERGKAAPNFTLENIEGETVSLADHRGQKVIVNFWATWCPPCREEIPDFIKIYEEEDVEILAINMTHTETSPMEDIEQFVYEEFAMPFPVLMDKENEVSTQYRIAAYPTSYIIDSEGIVRHMAMGAMTYEQIKETLATID